MEQIRQNYYGNLCTEMYEILHSEAPSDELDFYLSYAEKGKRYWNHSVAAGVFLSLSWNVVLQLAESIYQRKCLRN